MRRWSWLLGLLVIGVLGVVWWASRNAIRMEPLDAQRFAQMRETEQVEWLIEQSTGAFQAHGYACQAAGEALASYEGPLTRALRYTTI
jgi:hypothetical protein